MTPKLLILYILVLLSLNILNSSEAQPDTNGYTCTTNSTIINYPCQTYVLYRAKPPHFGDLASIGDLFGVSRPNIAKPSNISNPSFSLTLNQPLFIPITCGCYPVKNQTLKSLSFANLTYTINPGDTFYFVSTDHYGNLTTYQSTMIVNPTLDVYNLKIGSDVYFPISCKCPNKTQLQNNVNFLVTYVFQPNDSLDKIASLFRVSKQSIVDLNGDKFDEFDTLFVPVSKLTKLKQPPGVNQTSNPSTNQTIVINTKSNHKSAVVGLSIALGICGLILFLLFVMWVRINSMLRNLKEQKELDVKNAENVGRGGVGRGYLKELEQNMLLADVSENLDKYKIYEIEEIQKATNGFSEKCVIQGAVYKGFIDGKCFAIKKMKWNAYEELKILQKVICLCSLFIQPIFIVLVIILDLVACKFVLFFWLVIRKSYLQ